VNIAVVGHHYAVNKSVIHFIKINEDKLRVH
jgi:hypothetical protein